MDKESEVYLDRIKKLSDKTLDLLEQIFSSDLSSREAHADEIGEVVDYLKDFAEAKKCCLEACYYNTLIEAMKNGEDYEAEDEERYGYNVNRRSSGRYAPRGTGDMTMGYPIYEKPYIRTPNYDLRDLMGYSNQSRSDTSTRGNMTSRTNSGNRYGYNDMDEYFDPRYGEAYNRYRIAKRHYHDSNSDVDKDEMDERATEHMNDLMSSAREIYKSSTPEMRKKIKEDFTGLMNSFSSMT